MLTAPSNTTFSLRQNWHWIAGVAVLFIAFLVTFLQWRKQKRALRQANEQLLDVIAERQALAMKKTQGESVGEQKPEPEPPVPSVPKPAVWDYEIPILSPLLHFKVRPVPSPYPGAVQMEAWDNARYRFVRFTRDPEGMVGQGIRAENPAIGDAWVLQLCHHKGDIRKELLLPIENEAEPTAARLTNEIKTLLAMPLPGEKATE